MFSDQEEKDLANYVKSACNVYFGLSPKDVRSLAFNFATSNKKEVPESWVKNGMAGPDWFTYF